MEKDITLDQLPEHILEQIFSNVSKRENLRLVCKTFKNIIDHSAKLLKNKWLIVDCFADDYLNSINYHYQNFIIYDLTFDVFCWMSNYKHKHLVKAIDIKCSEMRVKESPLFVQSVLFNFNSLETIRFDPQQDLGEGDYSDYYIRFMPNLMSKLKTLDVSSYENHHDNALAMFSDIPSIKNLIISRFHYLEFPTTTKWQLEELIIHELIEDDVNYDNCKLFLESQLTLKKLIFGYTDGDAYLIMRNLANLEHLKVNLEFDNEFDDSLLLKNSNLRRLDIHHYYNVNNNVMKAFLNHYNRIKYLSIKFEDFSETDQSISFSLKFEHLTHLALGGFQSFSFLNYNLLSVKVLVMSCNHTSKENDFSQISNDNMKNVEKLCLNFRKAEDVFAVVQKCPKLIELNLEIYQWYTNQETFISRINQILETAVNVKRLGITNFYLLEKHLIHKELQNQIAKEGISLKIYEDFKLMVAEDWGRDNVEYIDI